MFGFLPFQFMAAGSGWISNNSTTSGEKTTAALLQTNEGTLVQRAEHIPAGKRTPMCAHCNQVIRLVSLSIYMVALCEMQDCPSYSTRNLYLNNLNPLN